MSISKLILFLAFFFIPLSVVMANPCGTISTTSTLVNVRDCGAVGNGGNGDTDDKDAIQAAINLVSGNGGGTVYFPTGQYIVEGTITVPSNVRIQGMTSFLNSQVKLRTPGIPIFEVTDGSSNIVFKDITLTGWITNDYPRSSTLVRSDGTIGILLKAESADNQGSNGIDDITIENVRTLQLTQGIAATSTPSDLDGSFNGSVSNVKIRNNLAEGNEYALYSNTKGADNWDVQNMNAFPMYSEQNGIFLERSGKMNFLQLSCAAAGTGGTAGICAKMWDNGDSYFRQMHVEGPRMGFCVGSTNCDATSTTKTNHDSSFITIENSATDGEFYRETNVVSINNRFWSDIGNFPLQGFRFIGEDPLSPETIGAKGDESWLMSCGDVWVALVDHATKTTVDMPNEAFPGLNNPVNGCSKSYLSPVPTFNTGYTPDNERLAGEIDVTSSPYNATNGGGDDTAAFQQALNAARSPGGSFRVFVPTGVYQISNTLELKQGDTIIGDVGTVIELTSSDKSLFKVLNVITTRGITWRNLTLRAATSLTDTIAIDLQNDVPTEVGAASDFMIQGVDFEDFETGIRVQPPEGMGVKHPMYDSVSIKNSNFTNNNTAMHIGSENASNWNLEDINITIPFGGDGVWINRVGNTSVRNLTCNSLSTGNSCATIQRQGNTSIFNLDASNVTNALSVRWENGWTQFPVTIRDSNLLEGVYFQGRTYLNSIDNVYPAHLRGTSLKIVQFGAFQEGNIENVYFGGLSDIFTCGDIFKNVNSGDTDEKWEYTGTLTTPITACGP